MVRLAQIVKLLILKFDLFFYRDLINLKKKVVQTFRKF